MNTSTHAKLYLAYRRDDRLQLRLVQLNHRARVHHFDLTDVLLMHFTHDALLLVVLAVCQLLRHHLHDQVFRQPVVLPVLLLLRNGVLESDGHGKSTFLNSHLCGTLGKLALLVIMHQLFHGRELSLL
jgi:hypothetical protein